MQYNCSEKLMITRGRARCVWRGKEPFPSVLYLTTFFHSLTFLSPPFLPLFLLPFLFPPSLPLFLLTFLFPFPTSTSPTFPFPLSYLYFSYLSFSPFLPVFSYLSFSPFLPLFLQTFLFPLPTSTFPSFPFPLSYLSFS